MKFASIVHPLILIPVLGLCSISLFIISSTVPGLFAQQAIAIVIGIAAYIILSTLDFRIWKKLAGFLFVISIIFLTLSLFGADVRGSSRWINIGGFNLQPTEILKPFIIIFFAKLISEKKVNSTKNIALISAFFIPIALLIFKQPDLGNLIIYFFVFLSMMIAGGLRWIYLVVSGLVFGIFMPFFWFVLKAYQKQRILSFINPYMDPSGAGYNALQSVISIGSGQFFGLGLGRGTQSRLLFLPEFHTDFIFASLGEELGFIGGAIIISFYVCLLSKILQIAYKCDDLFSRLLIVGVLMQLFAQVFINIGMNLGILPITGITLPLISYGGSSVISTFIELGLVMSIAGNIRKNPLVIR